MPLDKNLLREVMEKLSFVPAPPPGGGMAPPSGGGMAPPGQQAPQGQMMPPPGGPLQGTPAAPMDPTGQGGPAGGDPQTIIQQMLESGMSPEEIMQQLQQMGLPPDQLQMAQDIIAQLSGGAGGAPQEGAPAEAGPAPASGGQGKGGAQQEVLARISSLEGSVSMLVDLIKSVLGGGGGAPQQLPQGQQPMTTAASFSGRDREINMAILDLLSGNKR